MINIDVLASGVIPYIQDSYIVSVSETTRILDLDLKLVLEIEDPYLTIATHKDFSIFK